MVGRPPIGNKAMSAAELKRRQRAKAMNAGLPNYDELVVAIGRATIDDSRDHGLNDTLNRLISNAATILEAKGFDRRRSILAIQELMGAGGKE